MSPAAEPPTLVSDWVLAQIAYRVGLAESGLAPGPPESEYATAAAGVTTISASDLGRPSQQSNLELMTPRTLLASVAMLSGAWMKPSRWVGSL